MIIAQMIPVRAFDSTAAKFLTILVVAAFAVPLALPTFFEIPLALILLASAGADWRRRGSADRWSFGQPSVAAYYHAFDELESLCRCCSINMDFRSRRWNSCELPLTRLLNFSGTQFFRRMNNNLRLGSPSMHS
jgi:hypothetical protein